MDDHSDDRRVGTEVRWRPRSAPDRRAKLTKQGVRDLNDLPGKSVGRVLPEPPLEQTCDHPVNAIETFNHDGSSKCHRCKQAWDYDGRPI